MKSYFKLYAASLLLSGISLAAPDTQSRKPMISPKKSAVTAKSYMGFEKGGIESLPLKGGGEGCLVAVSRTSDELPEQVVIVTKALQVRTVVINPGDVLFSWDPKSNHQPVVLSSDNEVLQSNGESADLISDMKVTARYLRPICAEYQKTSPPPAADHP